MPKQNINRFLVKQAIRSKRKIPKAGPVTHPSAIERQFSNDLIEILEEISAQYEKALDQLEVISEKIDKSIPQVRMDAGEKDLISLLNKVRVTTANRYTREELEKVIGKNLRGVKKYNDGQTKKLFSRVTGVDLFLDDGPLETVMGLATANNVNLIQTLIQKSQADVENIIYEGFRTGVRHEQIAKSIRDYIDPNNEDVKGNVAYRARFIARDQVAKLNAEITKSRQTELGIKKYIWRTSGDERVREEHRKLEGRVFSWARPPAVGHPGEDFQCRCTAEPVFDDLIEED